MSSLEYSVKIYSVHRENCKEQTSTVSAESAELLALKIPERVIKFKEK